MTGKKKELKHAKITGKEDTVRTESLIPKLAGEWTMCGDECVLVLMGVQMSFIWRNWIPRLETTLDKLNNLIVVGLLVSMSHRLKLELYTLYLLK